MTDLPPVSVVVVSRGRPAALRRCLAAIGQLDYPAFEVVTVVDAPGAAAVAALKGRIKIVGCDAANVSIARNRGIAVAAGEIVAFIDDDAVPEPLWLAHLVAPLAEGAAEAAGGFVVGRNGISPQWQGRMAFADGQTAPLPIAGDAPVVVEGAPGRAAKTEGTNMAVRRDVLVALGGFDEAYRYYLDETDLNLRLAAAGHRTAIVPLAQVHHGFFPNAVRTADRVPRNLFEIGASTAVFLRKHQSGAPVPLIHRDQQRRRLLRHMVAGDLVPGDVRRLLKGYDAGWAEGMTRETGVYPRLPEPPAFQPWRGRFAGHEVIRARFWQAAGAREKARAAVAEGRRVTLFLLSLSGLYHRVAFDPDGYWVQRGGQFGRSERDQPVLRWFSARQRVAAEVNRLRNIRWKSGQE